MRLAGLSIKPRNICYSQSYEKLRQLRRLKNLTVFLLLTANSFVTLSSQNENIKPDARDYPDEKTPGNKPELFAPGKISLTDYFEHSAAIFSPDNKEVYWVSKPVGQRNLQIYFMKVIENKWTEMQRTPFSDLEYNFDNPVISEDGRKMFFASDRPFAPGNKRKDWDIWMVERKGDKWSDPLPVSDKINTAAMERAPGVTRDGSLYFSRLDNGLEYIYVSRIKNNEYTRPVRISDKINSGNIDISVFVAPDESYLIFEDTGGSNTPCLFISYKLNNGDWSEPKRLPTGWARFPSVSPDGKYLFFMTLEGIFWMNTSFIDELR